MTSEHHNFGATTSRKKSALGTSSRPLRVISVTSGKGGVGKTLTTVNLASAAARMGSKVLILDGDLGLANVDVVLGISAKYNINDVIEQQISLDQIVIDGPAGVKIIPSGSGLTRLTKLSYVQRLALFDQIQNLDLDFDTLIIDTGAGISDSVLHLNSLADDIVLVTTPEPHAMTDAYAMIKVMQEIPNIGGFQVLVNMAHSATEAQRVYERIAKVAENFLGTSIKYLGFVPMDVQMQKLVLMRQVAHPSSVHTVAGQAWINVSQKLFAPEPYAAPMRERAIVWKEMMWAAAPSELSVRL